MVMESTKVGSQGHRQMAGQDLKPGGGGGAAGHECWFYVDVESRKYMRSRVFVIRVTCQDIGVVWMC